MPRRGRSVSRWPAARPPPETEQREGGRRAGQWRWLILVGAEGLFEGSREKGLKGRSQVLEGLQMHSSLL